MAKSLSIRNVEGAVRSNIHKMNPFNIKVVFTDNKREDMGTEEQMQTLMNQIAEYGVKVPVNVKINDAGEVVLTQGFRRMTAIHRLKEERGIIVQSVYVDSAPENEETENIMHLILNGGKNMTDYELGKVLHTHQEITGDSAKDIERRTGFEYQKIARLIALFKDGTPELLEMVKNGDVAVNTAVKITKTAETPEQQIEMVKTVAEAKKGGETSAKQKVRISDIPAPAKKNQPKGSAKNDLPKATPAKEEPKEDTKEILATEVKEVDDVVGILKALKGYKSVENVDTALIGRIEMIIKGIAKGHDISAFLKVEATA